MPIFHLEKDSADFPPAQYADSEGLLAEGGGLSPAQLLSAYRKGLFFWFHPMRYIKWWSPDPRIVLFPDELELPDDLKAFNNPSWTVRVNQEVEALIRLGQKQFNTGEMSEIWLTERTLRVFEALRNEGHLLTLHAYENDALIGGVVGVRIGGCFFSEYIIGEKTHVREYLLSELSQHLKDEGVKLIDLHKETNETRDIGLKEISRNEYLDLLKQFAS